MRCQCILVLENRHATLCQGGRSPPQCENAGPTHRFGQKTHNLGDLTHASTFTLEQPRHIPTTRKRESRPVCRHSSTTTAGSTADQAAPEQVLPRAASNSQQRGSAPAGLFCALLAGVFGGLILAPTYKTAVSGLSFVPSFAVGAGLSAPLSLLLEYVLNNSASSPSDASVDRQALLAADVVEGQAAGADEADGTAHSGHHRKWRAAAVVGSSSGVVWNVGNACSILATEQVRRLLNLRRCGCTLSARRVSSFCTHSGCSVHLWCSRRGGSTVDLTEATA